MCEECQREEAQSEGPERGVEAEAVEAEKIDLKVHEPDKPTILETIFSVEGMFCGSVLSPSLLPASLSGDD